MKEATYIGPSIFIKGEVVAHEDCLLGGRIEGTIQVDGHVFTVAPGGHVMGDISGGAVVVAGQVTGRVTAERIELRPTAAIEGDLETPRLGILDGARFEGRIEMPVRREHTLRLAS